MPKMKTHSGTKKRFKVTGTGKIKAYRAYTSHMMRNKTKKVKRSLRNANILEKGDANRIKKLLCIK